MLRPSSPFASSTPANWMLCRHKDELAQARVRILGSAPAWRGGRSRSVCTTPPAARHGIGEPAAATESGGARRSSPAPSTAARPARTRGRRRSRFARRRSRRSASGCQPWTTGPARWSRTVADGWRRIAAAPGPPLGRSASDRASVRRPVTRSGDQRAERVGPRPSSFAPIARTPPRRAAPTARRGSRTAGASPPVILPQRLRVTPARRDASRTPTGGSENSGRTGRLRAAFRSGSAGKGEAATAADAIATGAALASG